VRSGAWRENPYQPRDGCLDEGVVACCQPRTLVSVPLEAKVAALAIFIRPRIPGGVVVWDAVAPGARLASQTWNLRSSCTVNVIRLFPIDIEDVHAYVSDALPRRIAEDVYAKLFAVCEADVPVMPIGSPSDRTPKSGEQYLDLGCIFMFHCGPPTRLYAGVAPEKRWTAEGLGSYREHAHRADERRIAQYRLGSRL
jgi:hypothetical protein